MLTASNTSKTAKIIKGDTTYQRIAVNMCINYSFFYIYICSFITAEHI